MLYKKILLSNIFLLSIFSAFPQDVPSLIQKVKSKIEQVNSYEADGTMKTNVSFLKVPQARVRIYFKKPDKLKIKNENGISLIPKSILGIGLNSLLKGNFTGMSATSAPVTRGILCLPEAVCVTFFLTYVV